MADEQPWWTANLPSGAKPAETPALADAPTDQDWFVANVGSPPGGPAVTPGPASGLPAVGGPSGMTAAAARGATFGLSDVAGAAGAAAGAGLREVEQYLGGRTAPETMGEAYRRSLAQSRGEAQQYAAEHPVLSGIGSVAGALTAAPAEGAAALPTLGRQMLTGAGLGATTGAAGGFAESQQPGGNMIRDPITGAVVGAVAGGTLPVVGQLASRAISPLARAISGTATENQALRTIAQRQASDVAAGGPSLADALAAQPATGRPTTLADVGGANIQGLAGKVARGPGEGTQIATDFLNQRDAGAPGRMLQDVQDLMVPSGLPTGGADNMLAHLEQEQQQNARRLYDVAMTDPATGQARQITDPALMDLVKNSAPIQNAMNSVRNALPAYAGLPDSDMRLLHEAYKTVGNRAAQAVGNPDAYVLNKLQGDFRSALTAANPDYGAAASNFADYSRRMEAIDAGRKVFNQTPDQITQAMGQLSPEEQKMFRLGAADTVAKQVLGTSSGGNEALRIVGNQLRQEQLRPLFETQDQFDKFIQGATTENQLFRTKQAVLGGSQTAGRLAEDTGGVEGAARPLMTGAGLIATGEPVAMALGAGQVGTGISRLARAPEINAPEVNAAIARRLYNPDPAAQQQTLADILALRGPTAPRLAAPIGGLAGQLAGGPGMTSALNWTGSALPFLGR
jgi:hypothetical protein